MPAKKTTLTDAERARRIREIAREAETSNDPKDFERAFAVVAAISKKDGHSPPQQIGRKAAGTLRNPWHLHASSNSMEST